MIEVTDLVRSFGDKVVLQSISFHVPTGRICGFVGPNGAGKTTTMRILATLDQPDSGTAKLASVELREQPLLARAQVGFMPDHYGAYSDMVVSEYLEFFARAYRLSRRQRAERLAEIVEFVELESLLRTPVEGLSKGQKQRLSLARTLLGDPSILILDEPAAGLDPRARVELRELLKALAARGKTIFISSHILSELSDLIDWLVVIDAGVIRHCGPPGATDTLPASGQVFLVEVESELAPARRVLLEAPGVLTVDGEEGVLAVALDVDQCAPAELLARLIHGGVRVQQFYRREVDLEDVFLKLTGGGV